MHHVVAAEQSGGVPESGWMLVAYRAQQQSGGVHCAAADDEGLGLDPDGALTYLCLGGGDGLPVGAGLQPADVRPK